MRPDMVYIDNDGVVYAMEEIRGKVARSGRMGLTRDRVRTVDADVGESLAVQSAKDDTDINVLMARFRKGVALPEFVPGQYEDVSEVGDYLDVQNRIAVASEEFMRLPPEMREYFGNNAAAFMDFVADPSKVDEGVRIGLYVKKESDVVGEKPVVVEKPEA